MMDSYRVMLTYIKSAVTRNYSEKCINNIMDFVSGSASQSFGLLQEFYQTTLKALEEAKNEVWKWFWFYDLMYSLTMMPYILFSLVVQRLWFKTNLKLCKIWFDIGEYGRMIKVTFFSFPFLFLIFFACTWLIKFILTSDFEGTPQVLSKRRWYRWSKERKSTSGSVCHWDSNVYWD